MKVKYILMALLTAFSISNVSNVLAKGNLAKQEPIVVEMTMSEFSFTPQHLSFETGKLYKLIIKNVGTIKHEIDSSALSHLAYTRKIQIIDKKGGLVAEVKGVPAEIEVGPGYEVEWWFVPVATTDGKEEFICLLPGHYEAGMHGTMSFE